MEYRPGTVAGWIRCDTENGPPFTFVAEFCQRYGVDIASMASEQVRFIEDMPDLDRLRDEINDIADYALKNAELPLEGLVVSALRKSRAVFVELLIRTPELYQKIKAWKTVDDTKRELDK